MPNIILEPEKYLEHPYTPNRKDNYLPNKLVVSNTQFSRVEQRLFEYFVNQIDHTAIDVNHGMLVRIPLDKLRDFITPRQIVAVTRSMAQKVMTFFDLSRPNLEFKHIPMFTSIGYNENNNGHLEFRSNPQLSPYLANLGTTYTRYDFKTILEFKSIYSTLMYKLIRLHLGQNRTTFIYSIEELRRLLQVDKDKYTNLNDFKKRVLEPVKVELRNISAIPINFEYENCGNKQRNVTHLQFTVITAFSLSQLEKKDFIEASKINPNLVQNRLEDIIVTNYNFRENHRRIILSDKEKINKFATLHIEFENGLHSKVKNKTAYILACLDMVKKKTPL